VADKSYREIRAARADQFADFVRGEIIRARDYVRQKVVEAAWSGQKRTPRAHDHQEPFSDYLGRRDYSIDIQGNRLGQDHTVGVGLIEQTHDERMNTALAAVHIDRNVKRGDNTAREIDARLSWENSFYGPRPDGGVAIDNAARVGLDRPVGEPTLGEATWARELSANPGAHREFDTIGVSEADRYDHGLGIGEERSYSGFMDQTYGIEPPSYGREDRDRTQQQK